MTDSRSGFGSLHMPRSRGAVSGLLLLILGAWGALIPFIGPYFHFASEPGQAWVWSTARAWLEVFPGAITAAGGFLLLISGNRATAMFGGWLAVIAGTWFVVGRTLAPTLRLGDIGQPIAATDAKRAVDRDRILLRVGCAHRLRRGSGAGAGDDPDGAGRGAVPTGRRATDDRGFGHFQRVRRVRAHRRGDARAPTPPARKQGRPVQAQRRRCDESLTTSSRRTKAWVVDQHHPRPRLAGSEQEPRAVRVAVDR